jgi:hypothetical protein
MADKQSPDDAKRDAVLLKMLQTKPQPRAPKKAKEPEFFIVGDQMLVAANVRRDPDGTITADTYLNLEDYKAGKPQERGAVFTA